MKRAFWIGFITSTAFMVLWISDHSWGMMHPGGNDFGQQTLLNPDETALGVLAGPVLEGTWIGKQMVFVGGFEAAAVIDHVFYIGFTGKGTMFSSLTNGYSNGAAWGGLMLGYSLMPELLVHPVAKVSAGFGSLMNMEYRNPRMMGESGINRSYPFFVTEAQIGAEINLLKWVRITPYAGYRYVQGNINWDGLSDSSFQNLSFGMNLDFGLF